MPWLSELLPKGKDEGGEPPPELPKCPICGGTGYVPDNDEWVASGYKRCPVMPCPECGVEARRALLAKLDGMEPEQRAMTFANYDAEHNRGAWNVVRWAVKRRRGIVTLWGACGRGKTHLLSAGVNAAVEAGHMAAYVSMPELLKRMREAIDSPTSRPIIDRYTELPVLAVDEFVSEDGLTAWGREQLRLLVDRRYLAARRSVTLLATNVRPADWPDYIRSRLHDNRCSMVEMKGPDMRPRMGWADD